MLPDRDDRSGNMLPDRDDRSGNMLPDLSSRFFEMIFVPLPECWHYWE